MDRAIPNFPARVRGFDPAQVTDYILHAHGEIAVLQEQVKSLKRDAADAEAQRHQLNVQIAQLHGEVERLSGPIDSVEGMSDRIARMMRIASDEAHRTKVLAREEADELTRALREEIEAARQDRAAAGAALAQFEASAAARREQILSEAKSEAEQVVQAAHAERARLADEAEDAERRRREAQRELAEEDARRRRDNQRRLDEQIRSSWEQASAQIAAYEQEGRVKAAGLVSAAERETQQLRERTEEQVKELLKVRGDVLASLSEIQNRIETAVRRERISVVKQPAQSEEA